jgi:hypothetical protein
MVNIKICTKFTILPKRHYENTYSRKSVLCGRHGQDQVKSKVRVLSQSFTDRDTYRKKAKT